MAADNFDKPYVTGEYLDSGHLVAVVDGLCMTAARREEAADVELDMPMVEVAEDVAVVRHGSLVVVVVVVALRAADEVLDVETGRRTFDEKMCICDRWKAHRRGMVWYRRAWPRLKHQERPVKPLCHHLSQP